MSFLRLRRLVSALFIIRAVVADIFGCFVSLLELGFTVETRAKPNPRKNTEKLAQAPDWTHAELVQDEP